MTKSNQRHAKRYSEADARRIFEGVAQGRVTVFCPEHGYAPGGTKVPTLGCKDCVMADLLFTWVALPPEKREEWVHKMRDSAARLSEAAEKGKFDFVAFRHPEVVIEREN